MGCSLTESHFLKAEILFAAGQLTVVDYSAEN
jgi:hypothetical protein